MGLWPIYRRRAHNSRRGPRISTDVVVISLTRKNHIATALEALVGIQREAMAELYGVRAVADDLFEIERVRWLQEANLAYAKDITYLKKLLEK